MKMYEYLARNDFQGGFALYGIVTWLVSYFIFHCSIWQSLALAVLIGWVIGTLGALGAILGEIAEHLKVP